LRVTWIVALIFLGLVAEFHWLAKTGPLIVFALMAVYYIFDKR